MRTTIWQACHLRPGLAVLLCFSILGLACAAPRNAQGAIFTLTDDNSVASFDTSSQAGAYNWTVDGVNQLYQQWFWFRIGNTAEQSLDTLPIAVQGASDTNFNGQNDRLFISYQGVGFKIDVVFSLDGGSNLSGASNIAEQITIRNQTAAPLDMHFFQYTDFDLQGSSGSDSAVFTNPNTVQQADGTMRLSETVVTPASSHREIALAPITKNKLNDGLPTTLIDNPIGVVYGPGNLTWAFQWDRVIPGNGTMQISKNKGLTLYEPVPEPATWVLLSLGGAAMLLFRRRLRGK